MHASGGGVASSGSRGNETHASRDKASRVAHASSSSTGKSGEAGHTSFTGKSEVVTATAVKKKSRATSGNMKSITTWLVSPSPSDTCEVVKKRRKVARIDSDDSSRVRFSSV